MVKNITEINPNFLGGRRHLTSAHAHRYSLVEAWAGVEGKRHLAPDNNFHLVRSPLPTSRPEMIEQYVEGLRKAGLSE